VFQFVNSPQGAAANGLSDWAPDGLRMIRRAPPADRRAPSGWLLRPTRWLCVPQGTAPALFGNEAQPLSRLRNAMGVE
jgi:hypothetical protein